VHGAKFLLDSDETKHISMYPKSMLVPKDFDLTFCRLLVINKKCFVYSGSG